jgi:NAD(P)H dehydrogenase (quinone)
LEKRLEMLKKVLVVNGHPFEGSFVSALFSGYVDNLDGNKFHVKTLELGKMEFDPVLRFGYSQKMPECNAIKTAQEYIKWSDHIVFFYPVWWGTMPSLLQGWIERVLTPGFAYNMDGFKVKKHLKGKTAQLVLTCDGPALYQRLIPNAPVRLMRKHILGICGIKLEGAKILGKASFPNSEKARKKFLEQIVHAAKKLN